MRRSPIHSIVAGASALLAAATLAGCAIPVADIQVDPLPLSVVAGERGTATVNTNPLSCEPDVSLPCADITGRAVDYRLADVPDGVTWAIDRSLQTPATPGLARIVVDVGPDVQADVRHPILVQAIVDGHLVGTTRLLLRVLPAGATVPLPTPTALSAGPGHSLAALADGRLAAWGSNHDGQLGLGHRVDRLEPSIVPGLTGIAAISAGFEHSLALDGDGHVWAWGDNSNGQVGNGSAGDHLAVETTPAEVPGLSDIVAVSAGSDHSLALGRDGTVWAWGSNQRGKLGSGVFSASSGVPTPVKGLPAARAIAAGWGHSIAVAVDGTVWIWGGYRLGADEVGATALPVQVAGLTNIRTIVVGHDAALAIDQAGRVWTWGGNLRGQLGDGTTIDRMLPGRIDGLDDVVAAGVGGFGGVAVTADGRIWEWGQGVHGAADPARLAPRVVAGLADGASISSASHVLALLRCGQVWSWGMNEFGQLGSGGREPSAEPAIVPSLGTGQGCGSALLRVTPGGDARPSDELVTAAGPALLWNSSEFVSTVITGTVVTLAAAPTASWAGSSSTFDGWGGDCAGSGLQTSVVVDRNRLCVARYRSAASPQRLRVLSDGGVVTSSTGGLFGSGPINCGPSCEAVFPPNEVVTLTATPLPGFTFTGWSQACSGTAPVVAVMMDASKTCRASYRPYELHVTVTGAGSVTSDPGDLVCDGACSTSPRAGLATLAATPAAGWRLESWSGDCSGTSPQTTVTMDADRSCTAIFGRVPGRFFLTTIVEGAGSVTSQPAGIACPGTCVGVFDAGTVVALTAQASPGHALSFWLGDCAAPGTPTNQVVMTDDLTCRAQFTGQPAHPVAQFLFSGSVADRRVGDLVFFNGHQSHVFDPVTGAENASGITSFAWFFDGDGVSEAAGTRATAAIAQYAFQAAGSYPVRLRVRGGPFDLPDDEEHIVTVSPATGPLSGLTVLKAGTGTGVVASDPPGLVTCQLSCPGAGPLLLDPAVTVTLTATPGTGSSFAGWIGDGCVSAAPSVAVAMNVARTCTTTFVREAFTLSVVVHAPSGLQGRIISLQPAGAIDCGPGGGPGCTASVGVGDQVVLRPDDSSIELGWFNGWSGCDSVGTLFACTVTMTSARAVTATFQP